MNSMSRVARTPIYLSLALALALACPAWQPHAEAGADDFEFAQKLAELGKRRGKDFYFVYARQVLENSLATGTDEQKELARYGLARLDSQRADGLRGRSSVPYKDVLAAYEQASQAMEKFAENNPSHPRALEAKMSAGRTRLGFVIWARETLAPDAERLKKRKTDVETVISDAKSMVEKAISYFDGLREGHDAQDAPLRAEIAQFEWVRCQHYRALVMERCSEAAVNAFKSAGNALEDYITLRDGQLVAVHAALIYGKNYVELAKCATDDEQKKENYRFANEWFDTVMQTDNVSNDEERIICRGYYLYARTCRQAGRIAGYNFYKDASKVVGQMLKLVPRAGKYDDGILALIELARIELLRERTTEATEYANKAAAFARTEGKGYLENRANALLQEIVMGGSGGASRADPKVLERIGKSFYAQEKWDEAISTFQEAILASNKDEASIKELIVPSWQKIARAAESSGDLVGCALAYDALHEIWMDGLLPTDGTATDQNMIAMGNFRQTAMRKWKQLYELTGDEAYRKRFADIRKSFQTDYPNHPSGARTIWDEAREALSKARKQKRTKASGWKKAYQDSIPLFKQVTQDPSHPRQDAAWVQLMRVAHEQDDWNGSLKAFEAATAYWNSKEAKDQAAKFATVASRRQAALGEALYWKAEAHYKQEQFDEILKTLDGFHAKYSQFKNGSGGQKQIYAGTLGHLVLAHIGKGEVDKAERYLTQLIEADATYPRLDSITSSMAKHFAGKAKVFETRIREITQELYGTREQPMGLNKKIKSTGDLIFKARERVGDVKNLIGKYEQAIKIWEKQQTEGEDFGVSKADFEEASKGIPEAKADIKRLNEKINKFVAEEGELITRKAALDNELAELKLKIYDPRARSVGYYYRLYIERKKSGVKQNPANVKIFAHNYLKAAKLRPEVKENWERCKELAEDYLNFEGTKESDRQEVTGWLGTVYYELARRADSNEERRKLVGKALERLQAGIANVSANTDLLVGHIKGDYAVVRWTSNVDNVSRRYVLPRVKTVAELKQVAQTLGKSGGFAVPVFANDAANRRYLAGVEHFRTYVTRAQPEREAKQVVASFHPCGFDSAFYKLHANDTIDFRLALAWVYSESERLEDKPKALRLCEGLVKSRQFGVEDGSAEWWSAQIIRAAAATKWAEMLQSVSGDSGDAKEKAELSTRLLKRLAMGDPTVGVGVRPETPEEFTALSKRIETLRMKLSMSADTVPMPKAAGSTQPATEDN